MNSIVLEAVSKDYGKKNVLDHLSITVKEGELIALLGHNGAGKTTTIKILSTLLAKTEGSVTIHGFDLDTKPHNIKEVIAIAPQENALAENLSVKENILLMAGLHGSSKAKAIEKSTRLIERLRLQAYVNMPVKKLSGGLKRRVNIAMALVVDPKVLFLDEPTVGLDPISRQEVWELIKELKSAMTIVLTTHYLEEADALADRIAIIKKGRLLTYATPIELKESMDYKRIELRVKSLEATQLDALKAKYMEVDFSKGSIIIKERDLPFYKTVSFLNELGLEIEHFCMSDASLDDVYRSFTQEGAK